MNAQNTVGIVGCGVVGNAMLSWLQGKADVRVYDPGQGLKDWEPVQQCGIVFVSVPTPSLPDGGCDCSSVEQTLSRLNECGSNPMVVIRSTVCPGTCARLQERFPSTRIVFMPEFLSDDTALHDFIHPSRYVLGFARARNAEAYLDVLALMPPLPESAPAPLLVSSTEAELIKYFANCWYATKVAFANQFFDLCTSLEADYEKVRLAASLDPMCGPSHLIIHHKGYRGFGGKCLPKDTRALLNVAERQCVSLSVLRSVVEFNDQLQARQGR